MNIKNLKTTPIRYICFEGNIGSGKSTLAKALAKKLHATYLPEVFEENTLLPLFYKNPKQFSFPLEYSFLITRFEQINKAFNSSSSKNNHIIVADYSIFKCLWFAKVNLSKKDFLFFEKHFESMVKQLLKPDLMVYVTTDVLNLQKNIKKRGRNYEQKMDDAYLQKIEKQYKKGMKQVKIDNVLEVKIENYYPKLQADVIDFVDGFIKNLK